MIITQFTSLKQLFKLYNLKFAYSFLRVQPFVYRIQPNRWTTQNGSIIWSKLIFYDDEVN